MFQKNRGSRKDAKGAKVRRNKIPAGGHSRFWPSNESTKDILQTEIWEGRLDVKAERLNDVQKRTKYRRVREPDLERMIDRID
jgi:hypothetical protein